MVLKEGHMKGTASHNNGKQCPAEGLTFIDYRR